VIGGAEHISDAVLTTVANKGDVDVLQRRAAVSAICHLQSAICRPGGPMSALQGPGHDVLQTAKRRRAITRVFDGTKAVARG
jgi:hypothetical protein